MISSYNSESLNRTIRADELTELSTEDLNALLGDLIKAIKSIDEQINETIELEIKHGLSPDNDWLHRAKTKRRICLQLAGKTEKYLQGTDSVPAVGAYAERFQEAYTKHYEKILFEELGPDLETIKKEAKELALNDVGPN